jgi:hypothetical protein
MEKEKINNKLDKLIALKLIMSSFYDGYICIKCNTIQGEAKYGVKKYYCKHITSEIDKMLIPLSKRISNEIFINIKSKEK